MRSRLLLLVVPLIASCAAAAPAPPPPAPSATAAEPPAPAPPPARAFDYPAAPRGEVVDDYHGTKVPDPYRPLEDLDAPATRAWVDAENKLADSVVGAIPGRDALRARIAELVKLAAFSPPTMHGQRWAWAYNDGNAEQGVLMTAPSVDATPAVLLDPNKISDGGKLAWVGLSWSGDGALLGYGLSIGGGDWQKWRFMSTATGADVGEELPDIKYYRPQITPDRKKVFYSRFPHPPAGKELSEVDHDCKVYLHVIGEPVLRDRVVYERPEHPTWQFEPHLTRDGKTLVVAIGDGEVGDRGVEEIVLFDARAKDPRPVAIVDDFAAEYELVGDDGATLFFKTNAGAPKKKIVSFDARAPKKGANKTVVPEGDAAIDAATVAGKQIFVTTLKDARHAVVAYALDGKKVRDVDLPGLGSVIGFEGPPGTKEVFYAFTSFIASNAIYRYDLATGKSTPWRATKAAFDPGELEVKQVFYPSKDGTKVPMFVVAKKGLANDAPHPTLLYGYGGFGISITPWFFPPVVAWLERGGVLAVANVRGGGEYGEAWHRAGYRDHKQVVFDDFIAAAEHLVSSGVTSREKLGMFGGSNGGLLVGAVLTQRPDLFAAAAPEAGVLDMLRFPLFGQGKGWSGEYGSPDDPADFKTLFAYSPLHNLHAGTRYPATLVVTADHDVRVAPLHSYKFVAALQAAQAGPQPILLRVETTSGHGGGTTMTSQIDQSAELFAFFANALGMSLR